MNNNKGTIVQYYDEGGRIVFDVGQALSDGGWEVAQEGLVGISGLELVDREDPKHKITVSYIRHNEFFNMYFVNFVGGGWLCLDHAINQYKKLI